MSNRVVFLDIDGVLLSHRSCLALGGWPNDLSLASLAMFDPVALGLLRAFCETSGAVLVLSSTWRLHHSWREVGDALLLPLVGQTPRLLGPRGKEIAHWLDQQPEPVRYAILDDDSDMLPSQMPYFVRVPGDNGFTWPEFLRLCSLFGVTTDACFDSRPRPLSSQVALDWGDSALSFDS